MAGASMITLARGAQHMRILKSVAMIAVIAVSLVSPLYHSPRVSAAPVITPKNLRFTNSSGTHECGLYTNIASLTQKWDATPGATSYNYKAVLPNGSTYGPVNVGDATSITSSFDAEGTLSFSVQSVYDGALTSDWADSCNATYDITKPVISSNIAANASLSKTVTITETVTDANPLAYAIRILNAAGNPVVVNGKALGAYANPVTSNTLSYEWDTTKVADGPYKIQLSARDKADNAETVIIDVTVDNTMPGLTIDPNPAPVSDNTPTISGTVDDNNTTVQVTIGGKTYATLPSDGRWSITTDPLADGSYTISAVATDAAGNITTPPATGSITTDTTAPIPTITGPANGLVTRGAVQINGTISEPAAYRLTIDGALVYSGLGTDVSYLWNTNQLPSGTYFITLTSTDTAGNNASDSISITIDNTAPNPPTRTSPADGAIGTSAALPFLSWLAVADSSPVVYSVQIATDAGFGNVITSTSTSNTNLPIGAYNDGTYFWRIQACDALGNCGEWSAPWQFTIDDTAPIITVDESDTTDTTPTVNGTVSDPGATVTIKVSGITYAAVVSTVPNAHGTYNWSAEVKRTLSVGAHTITVFAKDALGNSTVYGGAITIVRSTNASNDVINRLAAEAAALGSNKQTGVVGQSTTAPGEDNKPAQSQSNFLKLGWWWLPLILALAGATYIGYYYRSSK